MTTTPRIAVGASLGAVSRYLDVTPRALRYYEYRGLISVTRDRWNCRRYDAAVQRQVEIIVRLRRCGLGIDPIAQALAAYRAGEPISYHTLQPLKRRLIELDAQRAAILNEIRGLAAVSGETTAGARRHVSAD